MRQKRGSNADVAYLHDEAMLKMTYVIGRFRVAPIRHMTIPKSELQFAVYGVRLRKQMLVLESKLDVRTDKSCYWTNKPIVLQWLRNSSQKRTRFRCKQSNRNTGKFFG